MRRKVLTAMLIAVFISAAQVSWAGEIDDLRAELMNLRKDYELKIEELQNQMDKLSSKQDQEIVKIQEKVEKQLIDVEYVGRYNGSFQKGGLMIQNPSGFGSVTLGGYMDHEFENFQNTNSAFDQHRWILNIGAELGDRLRFYSEYEIEHGGPNANNSGDGEAKVEQAWVDYLIEDWINVRMGAVLVPFGRYNIYHDSDLQDLTDRPLVNRDIIPTTWTESAVGFHGTFNPTIGSYEDLTVGYETYVMNGLDSGLSETSLGGARGSLKSDNNNSKAIAGRVLLSPALGQELGLSGYWGKYDSEGNAITGGALDWLSTWGPLELVGEAAYFDVEEGATDVPDYYTGFFAQANYHFWPEFFNDTFLGRGFEDPTFTLVSRYGMARIADGSDAGDGANEERRYTLGFNYRPIESWVFKLEYQWNSTDNDALERGDNNGFLASVAMGF